MKPLNVAVIGDSAMWGQGLKTADKFYVLAANRIAQSLRREAAFVVTTARSGAKLVAAVQTDAGKRFVIDPDMASFYGVKVVRVVDHRTVEIVLPSGATLRSPQGDRARFYDNYPHLFTTDEQVIAFFEGNNEDPALALFGDIPATFPTITYQVGRIDDALGDSIDLVIMDGSVNDIDFEGVLDSMDGPEIGKIDLAIRTFAYEEFKRMVIKARQKFPRAVMLVTGYFSPFSQRSDRDQLEQLAKYRSGKPEWQILINDTLTSAWGEILLFPYSLLGDLTDTTVDIEAKLSEAIDRSEFAHSRGLYWLRRAIAELCETDSVGPGLYFVNPSFRPENSLFAPNSFLHQGYKPPEENSSPDRVRDAALAERLAQIPRRAHLPALDDAQQFLRALIGMIAQNVSPPPALIERAKTAIAALHASLNGPLSLRQKLHEVLQETTNVSVLLTASKALNAEIGRIRHAEIASFVHPNEAGARRYADAIVAHYSRHRQLSVSSDLSKLAAPNPQAPTQAISVVATLRRYGFDPQIGLLACLQHMTVDSVAVEMNMSSRSPLLPHEPTVFLNIGGGKRWRLHNPLGRLSTIDTFGSLHLGDIKHLVLELEFGAVDLEDFRLSINGKRVFRSSQQVRLQSGDKITFAYPT